MVQFSTSVRNAINNAIETITGASPVLEIRSGVAPATPAAAATGTLIASIALPADWLADSAAGVKSKLGSWAGTTVAAGLAAHYRIRDATPTVHIQGIVSEPWAASKAYLVGQQVSNNNLVYRATVAGTSAAATGPTGTGAGIVDGGVTWTYVGPIEMSFANTNFNANQALGIDSYDITAPNP
jgi:hypothetical protein